MPTIQWFTRSSLAAKVSDELSGASVWRMPRPQPNAMRSPRRPTSVMPLTSTSIWAASRGTIAGAPWSPGVPVSSVSKRPSKVGAGSGRSHSPRMVRAGVAAANSDRSSVDGRRSRTWTGRPTSAPGAK